MFMGTMFFLSMSIVIWSQLRFVRVSLRTELSLIGTEQIAVQQLGETSIACDLELSASSPNEVAKRSELS